MNTKAQEKPHLLAMLEDVVGDVRVAQHTHHSKCNHVGHGNQSFLYKGMNGTEIRKKNLTIDVWSPTPGDMVLDPKTLKGLEIKPNCANPKQNATICDPRLRTTNTQAECGGPADSWYCAPCGGLGLSVSFF